MRGFTLLEVMLSLAIISILGAIFVPVYQSFAVKNDLNIAENTVVQTARRAQDLSKASDGDTTWGVRVQAGSITLFRGASYATRNTGFDEVSDLPSTITVSGLQEVVFAKLTGTANSTGTFTLTSSGGEVETVIINAKGTVTY